MFEKQRKLVWLVLSRQIEILSLLFLPMIVIIITLSFCLCHASLYSLALVKSISLSLQLHVAGEHQPHKGSWCYMAVPLTVSSNLSFSCFSRRLFHTFSSLLKPVISPPVSSLSDDDLISYFTKKTKATGCELP